MDGHSDMGIPALDGQGLVLILLLMDGHSDVEEYPDGDLPLGS